MSIFYELHLFINRISSMAHSVTSVTTVEWFLVNYNPVIWVYPHATIRALYQPSILFLNAHLELLRYLFAEILPLFGFFQTPDLSCP